MLLNTKAHLDPVCIAPTTLLIIVGAIITNWAWAGDKVWMPALIAFALIALVSPLVHLFHHGVTPISGVATALIVIVAIFLLRFSAGNVDPVGQFYFKNLGVIVPLVMGLDVVKMIAP